MIYKKGAYLLPLIDFILSDNKTLSKMKSIFFVLIITISFVGFIDSFHLNDFDYSVAQSKQFQSYCVIMHCSKDLLINWNCKLCPNLTQLEQRTYLDD